MLSELNMAGHWIKDEPAEAWKFDEIRFDDETKSAITSLSSDSYEITLFDHSAKIDTRSNGYHCYIPSHYILYALKLRPFMALINAYMNVFGALVSQYDASDIDNIIKTRDETPDAIAALDPYSRENFFKVFGDSDNRLGAKSIINDDKTKGKKLRGMDDFIISIILKTLPVPDSNSSLLGRLVYSISGNADVSRLLSRKYDPAIPHMFRAADGDDLLSRIITSLGWIGRLDSLLGEDPDAEFIGWGELDRVFLLRKTVEPGHGSYVRPPVHYSVSLGKYVFIKKGLLDTSESIEKISELVSGLWAGMSIRNRNSQFFFESSTRAALSGPRVTGGTNIIFYGAPGTGKSYRVHNEMSASAEKIVTVFHPDTQYTDFVGALKPAMEADGHGGSVITYRFRPGPFSRALIQAVARPDRKVCLIIEEINRASAAAVFGELFQLLDRNLDGESTYSINAMDPDMLGYINTELGTRGCAPIERLRIPANLTLLATMNSSDQAVMPMDTAFKRRWSFDYLPIDFSKPEIPQTTIVLATQAGKYSVSWPVLAGIINDTLIGCDIAEDRLVGPFFLGEKELETPEKAKAALGGKLFIYLWDDVLRHIGHQKIFASAYRTFGNLSAAFRNDMAVFSPAVEEKLKEKGTLVEDGGSLQDVAG